MYSAFVMFLDIIYSCFLMFCLNKYVQTLTSFIYHFFLRTLKFWKCGNRFTDTVNIKKKLIRIYVSWSPEKIYNNKTRSKFNRLILMNHVQCTSINNKTTINFNQYNEFNLTIINIPQKSINKIIAGLWNR